MKHFVKSMLIAAAICLLVGLSIHGVGLLLGGGREARQALEDSIGGIKFGAGELYIGGEHGIHLSSEEINIGGENGIHIEGHGKHHSQAAGTFSDDQLPEVHHIEVEIDFGDIWLEEGDDYAVDLSWGGERYFLCHSVENEKLKIWSETEESWIGEGNRWGGMSAKVVVTVPAGATLEEVELKTQLGDLRVNLPTGVNGREVELKTDLGDIDCHGLDAGEMEVESDLGNVTVNLPGRRADYCWEVETDLGQLYMASPEGISAGEVTRRGGSGSRRIKATSDLGDVSINFS